MKDFLKKLKNKYEELRKLLLKKQEGDASDALLVEYVRRYRRMGEYDPDQDSPPTSSKAMAVPMAIFYAVVFIIKQLGLLVFNIVYFLLSVFFGILGNAVGMIIVVVAVVLGGYWYLQNNPQIKYSAFGVTQSNPLAKNQSLEEVFSLPEMEPYFIPSELEPVFPIAQDPLALSQYRHLITTGKIGNHAEGAIALLNSALYSGDHALSTAAYKSLQLIGTTEAQEAIDSFNEFVGDAGRGKNSGP